MRGLRKGRKKLWSFFYFCRMKILLVEPFFVGSHATWAKGYQQFSQHNVEILSLPGRHWKWRMYGGAVSLARQVEKLKFKPDLLLATDMLDLTTFLALSKKQTGNIPVVIYFHENQITYPWSPADADKKIERNNQYGFLNYTSALAADHVCFNSLYHHDSFLDALPDFLRQFPDFQEVDLVDFIRTKSSVLPLGLDLEKFDKFKVDANNDIPIILWNHRWEYDKNPTSFFNVLFRLKKEQIDFRLVILGEKYQKSPSIFAEAATYLKEEILHFGYAPDFATYAQWLWRSDILPVTNFQDFFGGSIVEAMYCNTFPILPNRLAYPAHIPEKHHQKHFYDGSEEQLYLQLKKMLKDFRTNSISFNVKNYVHHYDWRIFAPAYDEFFSKIVSNY